MGATNGLKKSEKDPKKPNKWNLMRRDMGSVQTLPRWSRCAFVAEVKQGTAGERPVELVWGGNITELRLGASNYLKEALSIEGSCGNVQGDGEVQKARAGSTRFSIGSKHQGSLVCLDELNWPGFCGGTTVNR